MSKESLGEKLAKNKKKIVEVKNNNELILTQLRWEQDKLYDQLSQYVQRDIIYVKVILGIYAVLIPVIVAFLTTFLKPENIVETNTMLGFLSTPIKEIFSSLLIVIGLLSIGLLRFILSSKKGSLIVVRQINCNRQAISEIIMQSISGEDDVENEEQFLSKFHNRESIVYKKYSRHVRLPVNNLSLRDIHCGFFSTYLKSSDGLLSLILTLITVSVFYIGVLGISSSIFQGSYFYWISGFSTTVVLGILITLLIGSWNSIKRAIECPSGSTSHS